MKIRNGFISNSSSSSFVIPKSVLTKEQIQQIVNHIEVAKTFPDFMDEHPWLNNKNNSYLDEWDIEVNEHQVKGETYMDNFDMDMFLELIGVPRKYRNICSDG